MDKTMNKIFPNVILGKNSIIEEHCVIGMPQISTKASPQPTVIGDNAYIRANTIIYSGVRIGDNFQTGPNVLIREGNQIGNDVVVWHGATLNPNNHIDDGSRIHAGCFLEEVILGKEVFLGPHVVFTDDPHPIIPGIPKKCQGGANVKDHVIIGGNSTILPHISIGKCSFIGAGSVVTKSIPPYKVAYGNPAKITKNVNDIICKVNKLHKPYKSLR